MSKRKKKKHHDEHVDESWLLPYADLLTLLLALFIVLFAMSEVDAKKFEAIAESFNQALTGGTGIMENPSPLPEPKAVSLDEPEEDEVTEEPAEASVEETSETEEEVTAENEEEAEELRKALDKSELQSIQKKVNAYIKDNKLTANLETSLTDEGLLISIRDNILFGSGSADIRKEDVAVADEISKLLVLNPPRNIIISGHTDNVPITNARYDSNWELSVMRSINFMKLLLKNKDLKPSWFSAKGYGEFMPIGDNSTKAGRDKNRRVEILILPRTSQE